MKHGYSMIQMLSIPRRLETDVRWGELCADSFRWVLLPRHSSRAVLRNGFFEELAAWDSAP